MMPIRSLLWFQLFQITPLGDPFFFFLNLWKLHWRIGIGIRMWERQRSEEETHSGSSYLNTGSRKHRKPILLQSLVKSDGLLISRAIWKQLQPLEVNVILQDLWEVETHLIQVLKWPGGNSHISYALLGYAPGSVTRATALVTETQGMVGMSSHVFKRHVILFIRCIKYETHLRKIFCDLQYLCLLLSLFLSCVTYFPPVTNILFDYMHFRFDF